MTLKKRDYPVGLTKSLRELFKSRVFSFVVAVAVGSPKPVRGLMHGKFFIADMKGATWQRPKSGLSELRVVPGQKLHHGELSPTAARQ